MNSDDETIVDADYSVWPSLPPVENQNLVSRTQVIPQPPEIPHERSWPFWSWVVLCGIIIAGCAAFLFIHYQDNGISDVPPSAQDIAQNFLRPQVQHYYSTDPNAQVYNATCIATEIERQYDCMIEVNLTGDEFPEGYEVLSIVVKCDGVNCLWETKS